MNDAAVPCEIICKSGTAEAGNRDFWAVLSRPGLSREFLSQCGTLCAELQATVNRPQMRLRRWAIARFGLLPGANVSQGSSFDLAPLPRKLLGCRDIQGHFSREDTSFEGVIDISRFLWIISTVSIPYSELTRKYL